MACFGWVKKGQSEQVGQTKVTSYKAKQQTRTSSASQVCPEINESNSSNNDESLQVHSSNLSTKKAQSEEVEMTEVTPFNSVEYTGGEPSKQPTSASNVYPGVIEDNQSDKNESYRKNKRKGNAHVEDLEADVKRLKEELEDKESRLKAIEKDHHTMLEGIKTSHNRTIKERDEQLALQVMKIQQLTDEKDSLLTRLSAVASAKLTDGNANIADLSDENRPTKLAEKYSELYDNEWTDAFDLLTENGETEENACSILLRTLCKIYTTCKEKANAELETMIESMRNFLGAQEQAAELIKPFKDQRKKKIQGRVKQLKKDMKTHIKDILPKKGTRKDKKMKHFLTKSIELCWLMVVQDPPVFMDVNIQRSGDKHDSNSLKPYTKSGEYIDYIVWPPIYLEEGGSILFKGIAQCKANETVIDTNEKQEDETQNTEEEATLNIKKECNEAMEETKPETPPASCQTDQKIHDINIQPQDAPFRIDNNQPLPANKSDTCVSTITEQPIEEIKNRETVTTTLQADGSNTTSSMRKPDRLSANCTDSQGETKPKRNNKTRHIWSKSADFERAHESSKHRQRNSQTAATKSLIESISTNQFPVGNSTIISETTKETTVGSEAYVLNKTITKKSQLDEKVSGSKDRDTSMGTNDPEPRTSTQTDLKQSKKLPQPKKEKRQNKKLAINISKY